MNTTNETCVNCYEIIRDGETETEDCFAHMSARYIATSKSLGEDDRRELIASMMR